MDRRWLAIIVSNLVVTTVAATACGQQVVTQQTLAERMAALRRSSTSGTEQQQSTTKSQSGVPQVDGRALLQGVPGKRTSQQPAAPPAALTRVGTSSAPRAGSAQASGSSTSSFTLPGLGGSRLPSTSEPSFPPADAETPSAAEHVGTSTPLPASQPTDQPAVRRSPPHRTAFNVNPKDFSRELAGSFPTEPAATTPDSEPATEESAAIEEPTPAADTTLTLPTVDENPTTPPPLKKPRPTFPAAEATPQIKEQPQSTVDRQRPFNRDAASGHAKRRDTAPASAAPGKRDPFNESRATAAPNEPTVLATQQTPIITTDIRGPRQIQVGREATYRVRLINQGAVTAENVMATIRIPTWADVLETTASHGTIQQSQSGGTTGVLEWQLARVDSHANETLDLRLVPRSSRPLELGVSYTVAPVGSRAVVEVQEPKLGISVTGPDEVHYGKAQLFRLTIHNPGTGTAENIKIDLMPPGGGEGAVSSHPLGDLEAGGSKTVEVELTPREAGKLSVKAHAFAEGGLSADADKEILCLKPELQVDWRGPEQKYAGTQATYFFRVRNPGTAPAENVTVHVTLPDGAEYTGASEGQSLDAKRRDVTWQVGTLGPGDDYYMELKCLMKSPGNNQLKITAAAAGGELTDAKTAQTNVVALADLKLDVSDPSGPVAVGDEAVYEIRVKNRGSSTARDVNVVALFSEGVEPEKAEGAMYTVADGRVSFKTIEELPAGRQLALRIRAKATQAGTHVFRAEVLCKDQEIKLAAEETTRFYADELPAEEATIPSAPQPQKSAERYQQADSSVVN